MFSHSNMMSERRKPNKLSSRRTKDEINWDGGFLRQGHLRTESLMSFKTTGRYNWISVTENAVFTWVEGAAPEIDPHVSGQMSAIVRCNERRIKVH